ncbi:SH3 domain-containing protein [Rhodospirillum sp. A1_3_36]|uniref:SH3 domain-containing protein n=1 Tax=Rhodospirillum sp. A1_3_36 TaxID=3391666 RepID=UPI0039A4AB72
MSRVQTTIKSAPCGFPKTIAYVGACLLATALLSIAIPFVQAEEADTGSTIEETDPRQSAVNTPSGLPLPRFVSLRANQVNMRSGPGKRYPVVWIYQKRGLPVEVVAEYDTWRKIRDPEGSEGWVHRNMLSGQRTLIAMGGPRLVRADPSPESAAVAQVNPGVLGKLLNCPSTLDYCRVDIGGYLGWLPRDAFWGVYKGEFVE